MKVEVSRNSAAYILGVAILQTPNLLSATRPLGFWIITRPKDGETAGLEIQVSRREEGFGTACSRLEGLGRHNRS